ncbi:hypothetical protein F5X99DRAFT_366115 [Biscogniauxia marginata]|nr:hypothetical protein F5X99DRAFT_366115 [Biscogniauxia marginata]
MMLNPRKRTMPLVPEPFESIAACKQFPLFREESIAKSWCPFYPNLNIPKYRESLSEENKAELDQRADKLYKRAGRNLVYQSSEFSWEVCAWHDVFGLILDDQGLRIDKKPYEFVEQGNDGERTVKKRIPDATFGLRAYNDYDIKQGYTCTVPDCLEDHTSKQPDKRLSEDRLRSMMHNPECGLVVDGVWGDVDLLFPFAVYEAKKQATSYEAAEDQIFHACRTYLAMLDDLARDPNNVAEYQTEESSRYQFFAFISCGSHWKVYMVWKMAESCNVETIWKGNVKEFSRAFDLICIVDQIHNYAATHHRPFVLKHLEAWYARHEKSPQHTQPSISASDLAAAGFTGSEHIGIDNPETPEWLILKEVTNISKQRRSFQTRLYNRKLRELIQTRHSAVLPEMKRRRGRPSKIGTTKKEVPKRGRGRPLKTRGRPKKESKGLT